MEGARVSRSGLAWVLKESRQHVGLVVRLRRLKEGGYPSSAMLPKPATEDANASPSNAQSWDA